MLIAYVLKTGNSTGTHTLLPQVGLIEDSQKYGPSIALIRSHRHHVLVKIVRDEDRP